LLHYTLHAPHILELLSLTEATDRRGRTYADRLNCAVDYITANLAKPIRLEDAARAAEFSPYHFHRIFRGAIGETLHAFIKRVRLERALYLMSHRKSASLTDIALACGFASSSDFSRSFRAAYGVSPRRFDLEEFRRSNRKALAADTVARPSHDFEVSLRQLPSRRVAYVRVHRPYEGDGVLQATTRLIEWARQRGLADRQWLGYQWDDPEIVPLDKCRYDMGVEVPDAVDADADVSITTFPASLAVEIEIKGGVEVELNALQWLFTTWLPDSGYAPAHQPMFEAFNGRPFAHGTEYFELRVQLPVVDEAIPL
jgi:AraC family transcriptional regulator